MFLLATAAAQETPIGRYLAYQQKALDDISKTCAYKRFLLKHDQNCAGVTDRPAPYAPLAAARRRSRKRDDNTTPAAEMHKTPLRDGLRRKWNALRRVVPGGDAKAREGRARGPFSNEQGVGKLGGALRPRFIGPAEPVRAVGRPKQQLETADGRVGPPSRKGALHVSGRGARRQHPLKVLSSSVAFGQCVECWLHVDEFTVPPMAHPAPNRTLMDLTRATRLAILGNRATHRQRPQGGRAWPQHSIDSILKGFGLYWLAWNAMIERVADFRFQIEKADYEKLCVAAGASPSAARASRPRAGPRRPSRRGNTAATRCGSRGARRA